MQSALKTSSRVSYPISLLRLDEQEAVWTPPLTPAFSLNVRLHAEPPQVSQQEFDEKVSLLGIGHPQYAAAVPCDGVVPTGGKSVSNMQRLRAGPNMHPHRM